MVFGFAFDFTLTVSAMPPEYEESFIRRLEIMWGEGFLSPGGADEVGAILGNEDLFGAQVLDIGSGAGGAALLLAREYAARRVIGVDIVPELVERSRRLCEAAGMSQRVSFELVVPGPLPFVADSIDVIFTKDSLLHFPDKVAIFQEIFRVLRPGGRFLCSDWLAGKNIAQCQAWSKFLELRRPSFVMVNVETMVQTMGEAGFVDVTAVDRTSWFTEAAQRDVEAVEGPQRASLQELLGETEYGIWVAVRHAIAEAAAFGALRPTHLRGRKPVNVDVDQS